MTAGTRRALTLEDIADLRAYGRERDAFRRTVIELKAHRRVGVGPVVTCTFENATTMRFQIQEMARAERMTTDEQIAHELEVYNRLIPQPGELSATLFLELTDEAALRTWLPALVGIERSLRLRIGENGSAGVGASTPDAEHQAGLTRTDSTAAVHYVRFRLSPAQVDAFAAGPVVLAVEHPAYPEGATGTVLGDDVRAELLTDLRDDG